MNLQVKENPPVVTPQNVGADEIFYPESDGEPMAETDIHANLLMDLRISLDIFFADRDDVYVSGNIMFYYSEGNPKDVISPDVMVCFGIPKGERRSYKTWEENSVVPSVVIELSSRGTWSKDLDEKYFLYERLGVKEYYIFNPLYPKNSPVFLAFRLEDGEFHQISTDNNRVKSDVLGLELIVQNNTLRLFDSKTREFLKTPAELAEENQKLKAELERLQKLLNEKNRL
jgi:Uma2 family endonuclease